MSKLVVIALLGLFLAVTLPRLGPVTGLQGGRQAGLQLQRWIEDLKARAVDDQRDLALVIDHLSGRMTGELLDGPQRGQALDQLQRAAGQRHFVDLLAVCHAELNLVRLALVELGRDVLAGCTLYTSTEPCAMCAGAIYWARIPEIVFGCSVDGLHGVSDG